METDRTRTGAERLHLLAAIGEAFATDTDTEKALATVARAFAGYFGDGCGIAIVAAPGATGGWHHDPGLAPHLHAAFAAQGRPGFDGLNGRVLRTGQALRLARTTTQEARAFLPREVESAFARHGFHSAILLPLRVPGRAIGVLTLIRDRTPDSYTAADQQLLQELADWVALASTTAQLARSTREIAQLTERERHQREAIAAISHDLRTPLASINFALGLLAATGAAQLDEMSSELLDTARRNTQRLTILIEDLLAMNQLDAGVLELRVVPLDLRDIVEEAARILNPLFLEKDQEVRVILPAPLPLHGDARRLEQVLTNLLGNAQRHTPPGTRITITAEGDATETRLAIADNGRGIPQQELEWIFARHHRREGGGGSGLGLATARALIEQHGGRLWAENAPEGGAVFRLALPTTPP